MSRATTDERRQLRKPVSDARKALDQAVRNFKERPSPTRFRALTGAMLAYQSAVSALEKLWMEENS